MSFSQEWEHIYKSNEHSSVWPWSDLVSLVHREAPGIGKGWRVLEIGSGAGANVSFFRSLGVDYFGVDGSESAIARLKDIFADMTSNLHACDFTQTLNFSGPFDMIVDRGSLTHNSDAGICRAVDLAFNVLRPGGKLISVDWFSNEHYGVSCGDPSDDRYTRTNITEGALAGTGRVHFSDRENLEDIFSDWSLDYLMHKRYDPVEPETPYTLAFWNIVASKPGAEA